MESDHINKRPRQEESINNDFNFLSLDFNIPPVQDFDFPIHTVFTLIVGGKEYKLSWKTLKNDGPTNFFVDYFNKKKSTRVIHLDRDSSTFDLIVKHLRGYYVRPANDIEHQSLLTDAYFYGLERLKKMLEEYVYVNVGGRIFKLPWSLFQKTPSSNLFNGPLMYSMKGHVSTIYIDKNPDLFQDLIQMLRGYQVEIKNDVHRENLIRDSQYYAFKHITERLQIKKLNEQEVLILLKDLKIKELTTMGNEIRYKEHKLFIQINEAQVNEYKLNEHSRLDEIGSLFNASIDYQISINTDTVMIMNDSIFQDVLCPNFVIQKGIFYLLLDNQMIHLIPVKLQLTSSIHAAKQFL
ncbi:hypothetical protein BCV72DRAFT_264358 [Rhizopus microsporus var. microsporus]|uniref:BTB domain-containing protein n=1 Tax=Rhizopus microsporus var. microsporus TaxID=86635 RepID=A0A1X0QVJ4_RHIZD|nr:hypothetical protein BCV72DRAFT_264358 [Rhizopus microsporus var. microsporus]